MYIVHVGAEKIIHQTNYEFVTSTHTCIGYQNRYINNLESSCTYKLFMNISNDALTEGKGEINMAKHSFVTMQKLYLQPRFEKVGAILDLGCLSFRPSVPRNFASAQYLEKNFIESNQILYVHLY